MSILKVGEIQNTGGVKQYLAAAWVNFNGTGTVAIRASGNVASITDNGVGDYTVNYTSALADANYARVICCQDTAGAYGIHKVVSATISAYRFMVYNLTPIVVDLPECSVAIFR